LFAGPPQFIQLINPTGHVIYALGRARISPYPERLSSLELREGTLEQSEALAPSPKKNAWRIYSK
jgi:hypothetical protein